MVNSRNITDIVRRIYRSIDVQTESLVNKPKKFLYSIGIYKTNSLGLPHFLCIGAQKAGTTWLLENLSRHPQVFVPRIGSHFDVHYFDRQYHKSLHFYSSYFQENRELITGECTPAYALLPINRIKFMKRIVPHVRIVFIMRNPIDRAWSHALMALVKSTGRQIQSIRHEEFYKHFLSDRSVLRSKYSATIERWTSIFPESQFKFCFFEEIKERPKDLLIDVFEHIGATSKVGWRELPYRSEINKGPGILMPLEFHEFLCELYESEIDLLGKKFGSPIEIWKNEIFRRSKAHCS